MTSAWGRRWTISVALTAALAIALLLRGNTLIGGLVGALALVRATLFLRLHYRRDRVRHAIAPRGVAHLSESRGSR